MKRTWFASALVMGALVFAQASAAQSIGFRVGVSSSNVSTDQVDLVDTDSRTGFVAGGFLNVGLGDVLSIQPEILYSQKGFGVSEAGASATAELDYIEFPLLLKASFGSDGQKVRPALFVGGFAAFEASCGVSGEVAGIGGSTDCDVVLDERETTDAGLVFGGGIDVVISEGLFLVVDGRYNLGLLNLDGEVDVASVKSRGFSASAGLGIPLGG